MVLGALFFALMSLFVKLAGERIPSQEVVFARGLISLVIAWLLLKHARVPPWGTRRRLLVTRGLAGFVALSCFYYSVIHLPLADATVIQYTNPVWTAWLGWWLLGERLSRGEAALSALSLLGVVLVARPSFLFGEGVALDPTAVAIALAGSLCSAAAYVSVRKLGRTEHPLVIVFYFTLVTVPASVPGLLLDAVWPTPIEWLYLVGVGVTALLGQVFLTRGLQRERAGRATAIAYVQIVFAAALGGVFFDQWPHGLSLLGALLVLASVVVLARRRQVAKPSAPAPAATAAAAGPRDAPS